MTEQLLGGDVVLAQTALVYILLALSIQLPMRLGVFSLAGLGFYGIGAYGTAIGTVRWELSLPTALTGTVLVSMVAGYLMSMVLRRLNGMYLGLVTFAFPVMLGVLMSNGGDLTGGTEGIYGVVVDLPLDLVVLLVFAAVAALAFTEHGPLGRRGEAVRHDPALAAAMGVDVLKARTLAFTVSAALAATAGGFYVSFYTTVLPTDFDLHLAVLMLTIVVVGGQASAIGAVIGAVIFTWLPTVLQFTDEWKILLYGALTAFAAIWAPGGLYEIPFALRRWSHRWRSGPQRRPVAPKLVGDDPLEV